MRESLFQTVRFRTKLDKFLYLGFEMFIFDFNAIMMLVSTKYKIRLQPEQIDLAKKHRKTILLALPILDFINSLEIIE